eukprot:CAMPEP_0202821204 /NCGR_PEP_ID=MMETSP1389-20130828/10245_1 /ASSEMBLY_ACC=CAM_ASM_000865 /TAXON_ID=302021 /ORGANISM="Rhodomonas sp., Strain CCMP768" /LENGTH=417 /DNA_ID=CAMNT_0049493957 /DNA_START=370 /DNA_END=1624 /DNA_ORIENTATION=-
MSGLALFAIVFPSTLLVMMVLERVLNALVYLAISAIFSKDGGGVYPAMQLCGAAVGSGLQSLAVTFEFAVGAVPGAAVGARAVFCDLCACDAALPLLRAFSRHGAVVCPRLEPVDRAAAVLCGDLAGARGGDCDAEPAAAVQLRGQGHGEHRVLDCAHRCHADGRGAGRPGNEPEPRGGLRCPVVPVVRGRDQRPGRRLLRDGAQLLRDGRVGPCSCAEVRGARHALGGRAGHGDVPGACIADRPCAVPAHGPEPPGGAERGREHAAANSGGGAAGPGAALPAASGGHRVGGVPPGPAAAVRALAAMVRTAAALVDNWLDMSLVILGAAINQQSPACAETEKRNRTVEFSQAFFRQNVTAVVALSCLRDAAVQSPVTCSKQLRGVLHPGLGFWGWSRRFDMAHFTRVELWSPSNVYQ